MRAPLILIALCSAPAMAGGLGPAISGRYLPAASVEQLDAVAKDTLSRGMSTLSWVIRPFAKGKMRKTTMWCPGYQIALSDTEFSVQCDGKPMVVRDLSKPTAPFLGGDGKQYAVEFAVEANLVRLKFSGEDGGKSMVYVFEPDGGLHITYEVFSSYLSEPLIWELDYKQQ